MVSERWAVSDKGVCWEGRGCVWGGEVRWMGMRGYKIGD